MAGYGLKSFLIAQSLNQIEKAYGPNNAILDNCHVRVAFATNDERTARRVSDALGTATELRAHEQLCRPPALAVARPPHGVAPGDRAAAVDARRGHAAAARRRAGPRLRHSADPGPEGPVLRGPAAREPHPCPTRADAPGAGHLRRPTRLPTADDWTPLPNPDPGTAISGRGRPPAL